MEAGESSDTNPSQDGVRQPPYRLSTNLHPCFLTPDIKVWMETEAGVQTVQISSQDGVQQPDIDSREKVSESPSLVLHLTARNEASERRENVTNDQNLRQTIVRMNFRISIFSVLNYPELSISCIMMIQERRECVYSPNGVSVLIISR